MIRTGRELAVRQTNSELGHHCLCVREALSQDEKASRPEERVTLNDAKTFLGDRKILNLSFT